jgi:hypothetical protein
MHVAGNMFTASCDYIQKLLPPLQEYPSIKLRVSGLVRAQIRRRNKEVTALRLTMAPHRH